MILFFFLLHRQIYLFFLYNSVTSLYCARGVHSGETTILLVVRGLC